MSNRLKLDTLDVYSTDVERVSNSVKRVIKYSDSEEKLFGCFHWYRENAVSKDKALWDRNFHHLVNRELGRMHISQDFVTKLRASLDTDVENFRCQHLVEEGRKNAAAATHAPIPVEEFVEAVQEASKIDEYTAYANMVKAGYDEAVFLGHILDTLWKHQDKQLEVMNDPSGNAQLSKLDQKDRGLDFARYMESRAKLFHLEENQVELKASLDAPSGKGKEKTKKREKKRPKEEKAGD